MSRTGGRSQFYEHQPITPTIGASVDGVDLAANPERTVVDKLKNAIREHLLLVFRDQKMTVESLDALGRRFGPAHVHPSDPGVDGYPGILTVHTDASSKTYAGSKWHSDVSCDEEPPSYSILHLHEVPGTGGDTLFASMYAAYDALSDAMKGCLEGLSATNGPRHHFRDYFGYEGHDLREEAYPEATHPVVRTHPETGRKALYVNETFTTHIVEMTPAESKAMLGFLYRHVAEPRFQCRIQWQPHTLVIWDNRCTQHHAMWDYYPHTRSGHRYTVKGERPV